LPFRRLERRTKVARNRGLAGSLGDGPGWIRTSGLGIKSPLLCQLSYRPREKRRRLRRAADDGQAPRLAGREQLVRVVLAEPAEEVFLGLLRGRAVDGPPRARLGLVLPAALERVEPFLGRRALCVPACHLRRPAP